jgi:hypothetical protein
VEVVTMKGPRLVAIVALIGACASLTACGGGGANGKAAEAPATFRGTPTLVAVDSSFWVVRDSDNAIYYVDGYYWTYRDTWHRTRSYEAPWEDVDANNVPANLKSMDHAKFVHYQGEADAQTHVAPHGGETIAAPEPRKAAPAEPPATAKAEDKPSAAPEHASHGKHGAAHPHGKKGHKTAKNDAKKAHKKDKKKHS